MLYNAMQAGGYFSILVCVATWWLAIAELTFDVTGKVGHTSGLSVPCSVAFGLALHAPYAMCSL